MRRVVCLCLVAFLVSASAPFTLSQKRASTGLNTGVTPASARSAGSIKNVSADATRFGAANAYTDGFRVWIAWQMEAEVGNLGFHIYRTAKKRHVLLNPAKLVRGPAMNSGVPAQYSFFDPEGGLNASYYIEAVGSDGINVGSGQIFPAYVSDLRTASGLSFADMALHAISNPQIFEASEPGYGKEIVTEMEENRVLDNPSVHRTVISQPGVRIGVKKDGFYRVTRAQLEGAGFDVNSDSTRWQLYAEGIEQPIIVGDGASYIEFHGKAIDTPETDIRKYFLIRGSSAGQRIASRVAHSNTSGVLTRSYSQTFVRKERTNYIETIFNGDLGNYFGRNISANPNSPALTFNLTGVDFSQPTASLELRIQGASIGMHLVEVTLNNEILDPVIGENQDSYTRSYVIPTSFLREGANSIKFRAVGPAGDSSFFDTMRISFSRSYLAEQNALTFYTQNYKIAKLDGFTSPNIRVFDMTRESAPVELTNLSSQQNGATFGTIIPAARGRAFYAVAEPAVLAPESVTPNDPELLSVPTHSATLVIIAYKDFMTQAQAWADYRRGQGITVKVIEVSELYDEFSYGAMSASSIKSFLQYAYLNWQTPPQYALLIGDGSWDSRNYEGLGFFNFIPSKFVTLGHSETVSDEALADFTNDGLAEIAIGRIPARTPAQVTTLFNKTVNWEAALTPTSLSRGALYAFDYPNGYDFQGLSERLSTQLPGAPPTFVFRGEENANTNLINAMNTGKFIVNYAGHGTAGSWGGNPVFFNVFSVPTTAEHNPSIYTMLTCLNAYFHWLYNPSMAEVLINTPNRGAVAAWASTGLTTADVQDPMAIRFYGKLNSGTIPRLGDLIKDAKTVLDSPSYPVDVRLSWALLGDPMLKVR